MSIDDSRREIWEDMQRQRRKDALAEPELPLRTPGGGGTSGGMEARIAKLEAGMDYVKGELAKMAGLPAESARIAERVNHLPTKADARTDIETAVDRASGRTQRTVAIVGGLITIAIAVLTYAPKMLGVH